MLSFNDYLTESVMLNFQCPSCQAKLRPPVESMDYATQVVRRKCSGCGEKWQLVIKKLPGEKFRMDQAEFTFLGR